VVEEFCAEHIARMRKRPNWNHSVGDKTKLAETTMALPRAEHRCAATRGEDLRQRLLGLGDLGNADS
jgi:hypothetical protein